MGTSNRVLIVDDNEDIHKIIRAILSQLKKKSKKLSDYENALFEEEKKEKPAEETYTIDDAYSGQEAIEMAEKAKEEGEPYLLIFMDVRMPPGIDGVQAISRIRESNPDIGIIICTAYSDYDMDEIERLLGSLDNILYLKKPFKPNDIREFVAKIK